MYRLSAKKWLACKDNVLKVGDNMGGLVGVDPGDFTAPEWLPSNWAAWQHLTLVQDRGGDGNSAIHAALYLKRLNVTEWWDENHDIGNDIFGVFRKKKNV